MRGSARAGQGHVQGRARPCPRTGPCVGNWTGPKTKAVATCFPLLIYAKGRGARELQRQQGHVTGPCTFPFVNLRIDIAKETRARAMSQGPVHGHVTGPCPWFCVLISEYIEILTCPWTCAMLYLAKYRAGPFWIGGDYSYQISQDTKMYY